MKSLQIATALFLIVNTLSLANLEAQQHEQAAEDPVVAVYSLQHAMAHDVAQNISRALEGFSNARATFDTNINAVIVSGTPDQVQQAADLIKSLDVPARRRAGDGGNLVFEAFQLKNCDARAALDVVSTLLAGGRGLVLDVDESANKLYARGMPQDLQAVKKVLEQLDAEIAQAATETRHKSVYVSLTLVVETSGWLPPPEAKLKPLDPATSSLLATAAERGLVSFEAPKVVTRAVTHVRCDLPNGDPQDEKQRRGGRFDNVSEAASAGYIVKQSGILQQLDNGEFLLDTSITINVSHPDQAPNASGGGRGLSGGSSVRTSRSEITSEIVAPLDHPVLLSFSAVNNVYSALILKLVEAD